MMMMRRTKKAVETEERGMDGAAGPIYLLPNVLTGVTLSVRGTALFSPRRARRPSRWMTVCPEGFYYVPLHGCAAAGFCAQFNLDGI